MDDQEIGPAEAAQMCLDSYTFMRPVEASCGHVTEIHFNNELIRDEHFEPLGSHVCAWCQVRRMDIAPENIAHLLAKHHLHVALYGEVCAFKLSTLTIGEWEALQATEAAFKTEGFTGFDTLEDD